MQPQVNNKYKTQLCRHFSLNGVCALGVRCQFAHGQQELRSAMGNGYEEMQAPYKMPGVNPMIANYKTQLCKHYNPITGQCKNGPQCTFAHGEHELNNNPYAQQQAPMHQDQTKLKNGITYQYSQAELTQSILVLILQHMEGIFPGQQDIIQILHKGQQLAANGHTQEASDIIKQVIHDPARSKEEKQQYQQIYNNAQKHYEQRMKEIQQLQTQQPFHHY